MVVPTPTFALDIETDTTESPESIAAGATPGLDPAWGSVLDVSVTGDGWSQVFNGPEAEILTGLEKFFTASLTGVIVTWNGSGFDLPFLSARYQRLGITTSLRIAYDRSLPVRHGAMPGFLGGYRAAWGAHDHVDIMPLYQEEADRRGVRNSLKPVFEAVMGEKLISVDREKMHLLSLAERIAYVNSDTIGTRRLALRPQIDLAANLDSRTGLL